jgi:hypothetical protein
MTLNPLHARGRHDAPNPEWRVTVRRWLFWGAIGAGLLLSLLVTALVRPLAPSGQDLAVAETKGPVEVYLELLQSYVSVRKICFDPAGHPAGRDKLVEAQKRLLRALDLGGTTDRQRQALGKLEDALVGAWNEVATQLRRSNRVESRVLDGEIERCLVSARAALREAAQQLSLSRQDLEATRFGQPAGGPDGAAARPSSLADLVQTFEEIVATPAPGPAPKPALATDSDGGRDEPSHKKP